MKSCDSGWWRINEVMYVSRVIKVCFGRVCDDVSDADAGSLWTDSVAATWDITQCFESPTTTQRWNFAAAHVSLLSLSRLLTAVTTSANVSMEWSDLLPQPGCTVWNDYIIHHILIQNRHALREI